MKNTVNIQQMSREELEKSYMELHTRAEQLSQENNWYKEQVKMQQKKLFGQSSEKVSSDQISLFDEVEVESTPISDETQVVIQEHKRSKKKHHSTEHLKKTSIEYTLSEQERICPKCDHELHDMSKNIRQELIFIPSKVEIIEHVEHIYSCRHCETTDIEATIIKAEGPKPLLKGSKASASLVANIINDKYDKALPLYRQEIAFKRMGIILPRQNMSNWLIKIANQYFKPMIEHMYKELLQMEYIGADETTVQVLHEPGKAVSSKAYMWVYVAGRSEEKQLLLYNYEPSRAHHHAVDYLKEYSGILLSDGYQAYDKVEGVVQAGCWAHCRRKFKEALDLVPKGSDINGTQTNLCFTMINDLFKIEKQNKDKSYEELTTVRQKESLPIVDAFFDKVHELEKLALPKSHLGQAITYASNQEKKLRTYLSDGRIEISSNVVERAIRPFTLGRKNWLFMNSVKGATSSAYIYSLVESAKLNNLIPYEYFHYILTRLPTLDLTSKKDIESIMPYASLPKELYNTKKS